MHEEMHKLWEDGLDMLKKYDLKSVKVVMKMNVEREGCLREGSKSSRNYS